MDYFIEQKDELLILYAFMLEVVGQNDDSANEMPYGDRTPSQKLLNPAQTHTF